MSDKNISEPGGIFQSKVKKNQNGWSLNQSSNKTFKNKVKIFQSINNYMQN